MKRHGKARRVASHRHAELMRANRAAYRDKLSVALVAVGEKFVADTGGSTSDILGSGIEIVSEVSGINRFALYKTFYSDNTVHARQVFRWDKETGSDQLTFLLDVPVGRILPRWVNLEPGAVINCPASAMPPAEQAALKSFNCKSIFVSPVLVNNDLWGYSLIEDRAVERVFDKETDEFLRSVSIITAATYLRLEARREQEYASSALHRWVSLMGAANNAAMAFINQGDDSFDDVMNTGLVLISEATGVDRVAIYRDYGDGESFGQTFRWNREEGGTTDVLPSLVRLKYEYAIPVWKKRFFNGEVINMMLSEIKGAERDLVSSFGLKSLLVVPVFMLKRFWGIVAFQDHSQERHFDDEQVDALRNVALMCVNSVVRNELTQRDHDNVRLLNTRLEQQELTADITRDFVGEGDPDELVNKSIGRIGEYLGASRVIIARVDVDDAAVAVTHQWSAGDVSPVSNRVAEMREVILDSFPLTANRAGAGATLVCNNLASYGDIRFHTLLSFGTRAFVWAPIYLEGELKGVMSVEQVGIPRKWSANRVQFLAMVASSISAAIMRGILDKQRQDALNKALEASAAKGAFLSNMSHEMRTPMNAIIGMTSIGRHADNLERKNYAFEKIEEAGTHLLGVINDVLDMSKIEAGKLEIAPADFHFEKMLQKTVSVINFKIGEKRQRLAVTVDPEIPGALFGDDQRLSQVITNLLSNATKFTPEEGLITLAAELAGIDGETVSIKISVTDTGIGISKEQQALLFQTFQQAETSTSRRFGGTGLGLAISKRIVELMDGDIWIESELGSGSSFVFTVKLTKGAGVSSPRLDPHINWGNMRILAVDDSEDITVYFKELFERVNVSCDTANSGAEALALIEKNGCYDVYFIDWRMPTMDGIELVKALKAQGCGKKSVITMITASEWGEVQDEAQAAGVDKYLLKPLFSSAVIDCVNECLGCAAESKGDAAEPDSFAGCKFLLAEDVEINREILISLFEDTGAVIDCAENGIEAVKAFEENPEKYDLIFMDMQMPGMDGLEATMRIRELSHRRAKTIPIIAMTANVFREDVETCLAAGMNDHIGKPLDMEEVVAKLNKYWARG